MMSLYNVTDYSTPEEFLLAFAKRFGLLGKRGVPDTMKAARALVQDWNRYAKKLYINSFVKYCQFVFVTIFGYISEFLDF